MRDQILGLEVVLADGRIWDGLRALRKDSSGYDLKQLFIGSEGTLGIITRIVVKLHPRTPESATAMVALGSLDDAVRFYDHMRSELPDAITAFELMAGVAVSAVCEKLDVQLPIETEGAFYVLVKLAASRPVEEELAAALDSALAKDLIRDGVVAATAMQEERLWTIREELPAVMLYPELHEAGLKGDSAVPLDRVANYYRMVEEIAAEVVPGAMVYGFGHLGDGNLHMYVLPADLEHVERFSAQKPELVSRVDAMTRELGGTLSAEHGVGQDLSNRVREQKHDIEWELMARVKEALDPNGLMNPGKVLPATVRD